MKAKFAGVFAGLVFCTALAIVQGVPNPHDGEPFPKLNHDTISAHYIEATNEFVGPAWLAPGGTHNTNIQMSDGLISITGGGPAEAGQASSWSTAPDVELRAYQGAAVWGHFTILNNGIGPGLDLAYCTGLNNPTGFDDGCDIANNSSDSVGEIWLTGGASGTSSTGTVQVVFGGTAWSSTPYCQLTLRDEYASWAPGATAREIAPLGGRTRQEAFAVAWDNNRVNMPNGFGGPGAGIQYFCVAAP